jgi:hypothetical protein
LRIRNQKLIFMTAWCHEGRRGPFGGLGDLRQRHAVIGGILGLGGVVAGAVCWLWLKINKQALKLASLELSIAERYVKSTTHAATEERLVSAVESIRGDRSLTIERTAVAAAPGGEERVNRNCWHMAPGAKLPQSPGNDAARGKKFTFQMHYGISFCSRSWWDGRMLYRLCLPVTLLAGALASPG